MALMLMAYSTNEAQVPHNILLMMLAWQAMAAYQIA